MGILYILEETVTILENPLQYLYILRPVTDLAQVLWSSYKLGKGHLQTSGHEVRLQAWLCSELKRNQGQVRLQASVRAAYRLDHLQTYEACKRTHTKLVNGKLVIGQPKLVTGPCAMTKLVHRTVGCRLCV